MRDGGGRGEPGAHITLESIRDGIVGVVTGNTYLSDTVAFLNWCMVFKPDWLTEHGTSTLKRIQMARPGEGLAKVKKRVKLQVKCLLRESRERAIIHVDNITPEGFMDYVMGLRHRMHKGYLSKSAYGNKRSSLHHLFRLHNRLGWPDGFKDELNNLYTGFYRRLVQGRRLRQHPVPVVAGGEGGPAGGDAPPPPLTPQQRAAHKEGKDVMSVELYQSLAKWFLEWGTVTGVYGFAFLVLSWNLACRANNTAGIHFDQISWKDSFDSFSIYFGHTKTDQEGDDSKYARHLYANPHQPLSCPVFALALYFTCCFNLPSNSQSPLFPGDDQYQRFSKMLGRILLEHEDEVKEMGYEVNDIGTHSIRKGAISLMASLPGGPTAASVCIRAGWTMGRVRDIYLRYVAAGDEFCGRCLALLPVLRMEFGSSPPHFLPAWEQWGAQKRVHQFGTVASLPNYERMTTMCLASLIYHGEYIKELHPNHIYRTVSHICRSTELATAIDDNEVVAVVYPWSDKYNRVFTGIPPHAALLQELQLIKMEQRELMASFTQKVHDAICSSGMGGGVMTELRMKEIVAEHSKNILDKIDALDIGLARTEAAVNTATAADNHVETGNGYVWYNYGGRYRPVPEDWRMPRCGAKDMWRQWWIGDQVRSVPPLRLIKPVCLDHLDRLPVHDDEMSGRTGKYKRRRKPISKVWSDLSFLMKYIGRRVEEAGNTQEEITMANVDLMFTTVEGEFAEGRLRNTQKQWTSVAKDLRKRQRVGGDGSEQ
jgi:hypothetical protein